MHACMKSTALALAHRASAFLRFACIAVAGAAGLTPLQASAQAYPLKPITIHSVLPAGGSFDPLLRIMIEDIQARTGKTMIINPMVGALGTLAPGALVRAEKDGYTVALVFAATLTLSPQVMKTPPFDPVRDLAPVSLLTRHPLFLIANPNLPADSVADLLQLARSKPGGLSVSYVGAGSQIFVAQVAAAAGVKFLGVPYKSATQQYPAVMTGETDMAIVNLGPVLPLIKAGKVKPMFFGSATRTAQMPAVPIIAETFPSLEGGSWFGIVAPVGTPRDRIDWLNRELIAALKTPRAQEMAATLAFDIVASTPQQMGEEIRREIAMYAKAVKEKYISMED